MIAGLWLLACAEPEVPPSLLLVTLDTTRADRIGAYGREDAQTPTLDRLAREGVLFESAVAPTPITLPSHASILTGVAPPAHGVRDNGLFSLRPEAELVSEVLRANGWRTGAFLGSAVLHPTHGLDQGFEVYSMPDRQLSSLGLEAQRTASRVLDDALPWLASLPDDELFFAWVHFFDPHFPYQPPEPWLSSSGHPYDGEIAFVDAQLGRLLEALEESGRARNLLVLVTADHGESAGDHGEDSHGVFLYQSTLRVPLLLWGGPVAAAAGSRVEGHVSLLQIPATLLAFAGLPASALPRADARPLLSPGAAPADPAERPIYVESLLPYHSFRWRALRGLVAEGHKLIDGVEPELYALAEDPGELRDLAATQPERLARLRSRLDEVEEGARPLGWSRSRDVEAEEGERLRALGYATGVAGGDPFSGDLPDPRERIGDLELVAAVANSLSEAAKVRPLEPGSFHGGPRGERSPRYRLMARAKRWLLELRERNPDDPHVYVELGLVESLLANYAAAVPLLERAVELQPQNAALHYHLAHAYDAEGRPRHALRAMRAADALEPGDPRIVAWIEARDGGDSR